MRYVNFLFSVIFAAGMGL